MQAAALLVKEGLPAADIGCDHAKLAAWLVCSGRCPQVIACDLREGPLQKAARTCQEFDCTQQVELRLGSGLDPVHPGEAATIILAGISAQTTIEILEAAPWVCQPGQRLVCVPATKAGLLRRWLWQKGFALQEDLAVEAAGRWYTVLCGEYTGCAYQPTDLECALGRGSGSEKCKGYREQLEAKIRKLRRGAQEDPELSQRLDQLLWQIEHKEKSK